ncbi:MAG: terminase family protein, partial [Pseudomonadota bacterium]
MSLPEPARRKLIDGLSDNAVAAMPYLFELWAIPAHQIEPEGDWTTWLIIGGRGAGKTRTGAEWIRSQVEGAGPLDKGRARRIALVAGTLDEARDVMVMGESGILACSPADRRPEWNASKRMLTWPNGAVATCYSGASPDKLRGPQFDCAWSDELAKWKNPQEAWDMLQMGLRLGERPRQIVTTTPNAEPILQRLAERETVAITTASTFANAANLPESFLREVEENFRDTSAWRTEVMGELLTDQPGALWTREVIERNRALSAPEMERVVVAVDPPASSGANADECGIVVAGRGRDGRAYVLADWSEGGLSPRQWAGRAVEAYRAHDADVIVAERNQGGEMVGTTIEL